MTVAFHMCGLLNSPLICLKGRRHGRGLTALRLKPTRTQLQKMAGVAVVQTFNPSTRMAEAGHLCEFKVSLVYTVTIQGYIVKACLDKKEMNDTPPLNYPFHL